MQGARFAPKKKNREDAVHAPTEKSEVNLAYLAQIRAGIELLEGKREPGAVQQAKDPIYNELSGIGDPALEPFLLSRQEKVLIDLSSPMVGRKSFEESLQEGKESSYLQARRITPDLVEITNPYYLPPLLRESEGEFAKSLRSMLKRIADSGSPSAISVAYSCFMELNSCLAERDAILQQASAAPEWLQNPLNEIADGYLSLANHLLGRVEHLEGQATGGKKPQFSSFPPSFEKRKEQILSSIAEAQKRLFSSSLGKSAINRIEFGIKNKLYSLVEIAFYENVKQELAKSLSEANKEGFEALGTGKGMLAMEYVGMLETMAWKSDLWALRRRLNAVGHAGEPILKEEYPFIFDLPRAMRSISPKKPATMEVHGRRAQVVDATRFGKGKEELTPEQMASIIENSKRELVEISARASAYSDILSGWIEKGIKQLSSDEKSVFVQQLEATKKTAGALSDEARWSFPKGKEILAPPKDKHWVERQELDSIKDPAFRRRKKDELDLKYGAGKILSFTDKYVTDVSREQTAIGESLLNSLDIRKNEQILLDDNAAWYTKAAAFNRMVVLDNAVPILAASTALGAVGGALAGGVGAKPGAALGWGTGSAILWAAGTFNSGEAVAAYINASTEAQEEQALANLRSSAFYMGFGIGGGALKFFSGAASKTVSAGAFGGIAAANSLLVYKDVEKAVNGDMSSLWNLPVDVTFVALGAVGFIKTIRGAWVAVPLPKYMQAEIAGKSLAAGSFGIVEQQAGARLPGVISRAVNWGYGPRGVAFNSVFSLPFVLPEIEDAAGKGDYRRAFSAFSREFTAMSGNMVAFEFLIFSPGKAGITSIVRRFPVKTAERVSLIQSHLHREVSRIAAETGAEVGTPKMQERIIELALGSRGKVSAEEAQAMLGLKGEAGARAAEKIAAEIKSSWELAAEVYPIKGTATAKTLKKAWETAGKWISEEKSALAAAARAARPTAAVGARYSMPILIGAILYQDYKSAKMKKLDMEMAKSLAPNEVSFRRLLIRGEDPLKKMLGIPEISNSGLLEAFGEVNSREYGKGKQALAEKRLRIAASWALLMAGNPASAEDIEKIAKEMKGALGAIGLGLSSALPVDSLAQMGLVISKKGSPYFAEAYKSNSESIYEGGWFGPQELLFAQNAAGIFSALALKKSAGWAATLAFDFLDAIDSEAKTPEEAAFVGGEALLNAIVSRERGESARGLVREMIDLQNADAIMAFAALMGIAEK